ncbi:suppressor of glycerol defect [Podochytrium sp. JEL0797]|nr:suppressor of glycerol defect [Podochytrium sp. JEL0797]
MLAEHTSSVTGDVRLTHKQQKELDKRFKYSYNKKKVFGRKEERKQKRLEKKQVRGKVLEARTQANKDKAAGKKVTPPTNAKKSTEAATKTATKPDTTSKSSSSKKPVSSTVQDDAATTRRKLEKIQQKNPVLFKMLQSTSVGVESGMGGAYGAGGGIGAWSADGTTPYDRDDEEIAYYSKKLGRTKMYKNSLKKDGLDDLFESLDTKKAAASTSADDKEEPVKEISDLKALQQRPSKMQLAAAKEKEEAEKAKAKATKAKKDSAVAKKEVVAPSAAAKKKPSKKQPQPESSDEEEEESDEDGMDLDLAGGDSEEDDFGLGAEGDESEGDSEDDFDFGSEAEVSDIEMNEGSEDGEDSEEDGEEMESDDDEEEADVPAPKASKAKKSAQQPEPAAKQESSAPAGKYIPPRLRAKVENQSEKYMRLKRQVQGLLNKLSDTNIESIVTGLEECYRGNSRHDVTEIITETTIGFISNHANLLDAFVMTYAALLSCIFNVIGIEFGAHLTQTTVELYIKSMEETANLPTSLPDEDDEKVTDHPSKRATNLVTLLSHLYNFNIVGAPLIYDLVRACLDRMLPLDVEIILKLLRVCGAQMRSDDPSALKEIVELVHEKSVKKVDPAFNTPRVKFMIETIMDLKNNKHKASKKGTASGASGAATGIQQDKLSKFINGFLKRRGTPDREPLRVNLDDIKNVVTKGKWWLVGAAWAGHQEDGSTVLRVDPDVEQDVDGVGADLLRLAKSQRMTTDIRRSVFVALMSAEDFVDAYEKLTRLGLKQKQEREIVRVLLHCCTNEKTYNPYYYLVATKFCSASHGFKITFQYALWDAVREFESGHSEDSDNEDDEEDGTSSKTLRKISHLAKFYSALVAGGFLGLTIMKSLDFATMSTYPALYCQLFFSHLLISTPPPSANAQSGEEHVRKIFEKLKAIKESMDVCEGIEFFLDQYVMPRGKEGKPRMGVSVDSLGITMGGGESLEDLLKRRVKMVREILVNDEEY